MAYRPNDWGPYGPDPRDMMRYMEDLHRRLSRIEDDLRTAPALTTFVHANYPEVVEQFEQVQATKRRIAGKDK